MAYNKDNIFAQIINKKVKANIILESTHSIAFEDIAPKADTHLLLIPKGPYRHIEDFLSYASLVEKEDFYSMLKTLIKNHPKGFRLVTNQGTYGSQSVEHYHIHLLSGKDLEPYPPISSSFNP